MILSIDPGKNKCGLAVVAEDGKVLEKKVIEQRNLSAAVQYIAAQYRIKIILVGQGTFGKRTGKEILKLDLKANLIFVAEKYSTFEARRRYWKENPPTGWLRFIPTSFRTPPVPVDDYAAVILAERFQLSK